MHILITTLAAFAACALGVQPPQGHAGSTKLVSRLRKTAARSSGNKTHSGLARPPSCLQNTGVSCISEGCSASQECKYGQCFCGSGCTSAAGRCLNEDNVLVATGIRFKNVRWPTYYMVASAMDSEIHVAANKMDPLAQFSLYRLAGQSGEHPQDFLLVPQASPAHSVSVVHRYHCMDLMDKSAVGKDQHNTTLTGKSCSHTWEAETQPMSPSFSAHPAVQETAVRFSLAPTKRKGGVPEGAITIRGSGHHVNRYMFVHVASWQVGTRDDDPGLGGYWVPEPPLPFQVPAYVGPPCAHACDSFSGRSAMVGGGLLFALAVAFLA